MGQGSPGGMGKQPGLPGDRKQGDGKKEKKYEPPAAPFPCRPEAEAAEGLRGGGAAPRRGAALKVPPSPAQARTRQGLPPHGRGVRRQPGAPAPQRG